MTETELDKNHNFDNLSLVDITSNDKSQIIHEAKQCFVASSGKTKKLIKVLTNCLYIILKGDSLTKSEATDLCLYISHLFQYKDKDNTLRRLTYIGIKALSQQADNVYVVTSSLTTDVNSSRDDPAVRASALRALCQISDASTFTTIERYLRQSVVDKHPVVASAALTSLIRIAQVNGEIVRRCTNEIQEALNSDSPMVQYHALALNYTLLQNEDHFKLQMFLDRCIDRDFASPLATCLLLRILSTYIIEFPNDIEARGYAAYIRDCLDHQSEVIVYEAARATLNISRSDTKTTLRQNSTTSSLIDSDKSIQNKINLKNEESIAISRLRNFLTSPKSALRFGAVRVLNEIQANELNTRSWNIHRIGNLCCLHLLSKRYKPSDEIIGIIDFINANVVCVKYNCILQCEELDEFELKQEFCLGYKQSDFSITIPQMANESTTQGSTLHCVLSFLFYIADKNHPKSFYEDKAGTIELGPSELETKLFSCDFPILVHV